MAKNLYTQPTDLVFKALSDPTRRQVLEALSDSELPAGEIASRFPISGPSVSRHLAVLRGAGLVSERREANRIIYSLVPEQLATTACAWLRTTFGDAAYPEALPNDAPTRERAKGSKKKASKYAGKRKLRKRMVAGKQPAVPSPDTSIPEWEEAEDTAATSAPEPGNKDQREVAALEAAGLGTVSSPS